MVDIEHLIKSREAHKQDIMDALRINKEYYFKYPELLDKKITLEEAKHYIESGINNCSGGEAIMGAVVGSSTIDKLLQEFKTNITKYKLEPRDAKKIIDDIEVDNDLIFYAAKRFAETCTCTPISLIKKR